jgi:acetolactate synthase-like protein
MHGGDLIARVLQAQGTRWLFTLCGGHISPILVGCKRLGIRVIDTRHEATAVFAADAVARLTGRPGVAAVTAGPGLTNTITAIKNAQIAQSPIVVLGGATATLLKGRGALQDIDQMALVRPHVKWAGAARRVAELVPLLERAFREALNGVPGPVLLECPVDLLYDEGAVRGMYGAAGGSGRSLAERATRLYLRGHVARLFAGAQRSQIGSQIELTIPVPEQKSVEKAIAQLRKAERPLMLVGSQCLLDIEAVSPLAQAITRLGIPTYLSGMARGLLGKEHPLQMRHKRREALKEADLVLLAGVPCDFRLDYGRHIRRSACYIAANRSKADLVLNRRPTVAVLGDPGHFLRQLAAHAMPTTAWQGWRGRLRERDNARNNEIASQSRLPNAKINPLHLCTSLESALGENSILVGDGGDFVATAAYTLSPRGPLCWLDPGPFGTLGVGAGFAIGAKLARPEAEVWALFGDGALGYSLAEFDTMVRHNLPIIALVGNDGGWTQIAREQVEMLGDAVGTELAFSDYHRVAEGFGAAGIALDDPELVGEALAQAQELARNGTPVLLNTLLGKTDFRKGSISM